MATAGLVPYVSFTYGQLADYAGVHRYLTSRRLPSTQVMTTTDGTPLGQVLSSPLSSLRGGHFTVFGDPPVIGS